MSIRFRAAVAVLAAGAAAGLVPVPASAAGASVRLSPAAADPDYATVLTLRGTGFQSIPKGHGGIYVLFGTVSGDRWRPSQGGATGTTYRYVQDSETKDNNGYQRFVAFPGGDTAYAANGGTIAPDGTWSAKLVVPGARFPAADRTGKATTVDCSTVQCGVITVGAHGVVNPENETFTPVTFAVPGARKPAVPKTAAPPPASSPPPPSSSAAKPAPAVTAAMHEARAGDKVPVTGRGFAPNERISVVLHSDPVSLPDAKADANGVFAYVASLPDGLPPGEHRIAFTGATSATEVSAPLSVAAPPVAAVAQKAVPAAEPSGWPVWATVVFAVAAVLVLAVAGFLLWRRARSRAAANS
ncbi:MULTISPECIES: hypothetical protein [Amycolatopsis]|uniref:hypothetical protein n=1 Tax=Amycolatopsis TaxID=1813 RepID=UPI0007E1849F|nr:MULTISPECIES: hypothetical protein [Amycolatopsis]OAP20244.1 hypothetical protein A4R44_08998 [Amycolatopsis sp. M39]